MTCWREIGLLRITLLTAALMAPGSLYAATDGKAADELRLQSAGDLVAVCTLEPTHEHYQEAVAFCYGFFEGGIRYNEAIANTKTHRDLVCAPEGTTRKQAVEVFVSYMQKNPRYSDEQPIDAIFRALMARWPCPE
jgi:hypothetical protein